MPDDKFEKLSEEAVKSLLAVYVGLEEIELPPQADELIKECCQLPLAVIYIATQIRESSIEDWDSIVQTIRDAYITGLESALPDNQQIDLLRSIVVSMLAIKQSDWKNNSHYYRCYLDLAVFPQGVSIPKSTLQLFWGRRGINADQAESYIVYLKKWWLAVIDEQDNVKLLEPLSAYLSYQSQSNLTQLHKELLDCYRKKCANQWHKLDVVADNYIYNNIGYHMVEAGQQDELRALLLDFDWLQTKLLATDIHSIIKDFQRVSDGDEAVSLVERAINKSAQILAKDKDQLAGQLLGQLMTQNDNDEINRLRQQIEQWHGAVWLQPLTPSLKQADEPSIAPNNGLPRSVSSIAITADGELSISGSGNGILKLWDLKSSKLLHMFRSHSIGIRTVAITADGQLAITGTHDHKVQLWDLQSRKLLHTFDEHYSLVNSVAIKPDGTLAFSTSEDETVRLWDIKGRRLLKTVGGITRPITSVAITSNCKLAISGAYDATVMLWDLNRMIVIHTFDEHSDSVNSVAITADGAVAISGSRDNTVRLWDLKGRTLLHTFQGHSGSVNSVAITPDGRLAISGSHDKTVKLWDLQSVTELATFTSDFEVTAIAIAPDGQTIMVGDASNQMHFLKVKQG